MINAESRDTIVGVGILAAVVLGALIVLGTIDLQLDDVQAAKNVATAVIGAIAGLAVSVAGGALAVVGFRQQRGLFILLGALLILIGLPLVGVTVGLPEPLRPFFGFLQAIVDLLNLIIGWF